MKPEIDLLTTSLIRLQTKLQKHGIRSALIGGLALAIWARPRVQTEINGCLLPAECMFGKVQHRRKC